MDLNIWEGFIPHIPKGTLYKYHINGFEGIETVKADPYAMPNSGLERPRSAWFLKRNGRTMTG